MEENKPTEQTKTAEERGELTGGKEQLLHQLEEEDSAEGDELGPEMWSDCHLDVAKFFEVESGNEEQEDPGATMLTVKSTSPVQFE